MSQRDRMMRLLKQAQAGDQDAHREVAMYCFEQYKGRIRRLYSLDPAVSEDDLLSTFFEAIWRAVLEADHRGNPLYHIGQRGMWAAQSEIRSVRQLLNHREPVYDPTTLDWLIREDRDFREEVHDRVSAQQQVRIITQARLSPRVREILSMISDDPNLQPTEGGFNKRLAAAAGISPQRACQVMASVRAKVAQEGLEP